LLNSQHFTVFVFPPLLLGLLQLQFIRQNITVEAKHSIQSSDKILEGVKVYVKIRNHFIILVIIRKTTG
ncbi:hypothetical protein ACJX0J_019583, partial [Zea mays]